jgi:hypothetical protein
MTGGSGPTFRIAPNLSQAEVVEIRRERVARELRRYAGATNPITMFAFYNRTRREMALSSFGVLRAGGTALCPYLDHRVVDLLASLPPDVTLDQQLHTDTISFAHPGFSAVPYSADWPVEPPRKEIWRLASAVFADGLRTRPARASTAARLLGQGTKRMLRQERRPDDLL